MLDSPLQSVARHAEARLDSYKRLADVFHHVLSEQSLDALLERIADTLKDLLDYDTLIIYEADEPNRRLVPVLARDQYAEEIMRTETLFGSGITGAAAEQREPILANQAHLDPRVEIIPGTPLDPESFMAIPLVARGSVKGALAIYRLGEEVSFDAEEFELAIRFGDAAALGIDNAQQRAELQRQAQTDSLTGLFNHRHFHERLRSELNRTSRMRDSVGLVVLDIDDFKRVNDVFGHATGDAVLVALADLLRGAVRLSDVVCRLGGEEFAVIMPSCDAGDAFGLASRLRERLDGMDFDPAGKITVSIGIAQGPAHAANPRELVACAEAAMMTAKARGKDRVVLFEEDDTERPDHAYSGRDVRSIAHLKMLQSLSGKLNRLNDVKQIGQTIANELRTLIDYHSCRVYLAEGRELIPIAFKGGAHDYPDEDLDNWIVGFGEGITGRVAETGRSLLIPNALDCEWAVQVPGTTEIEESLIAVPLCYGTRVIGVVVTSKLGTGQFDEDDMRLLEVLGGNASVALENARLYERQRREAEHANALLKFSDVVSKAPSLYAIANESVRTAARLLETNQASLWVADDKQGCFKCLAHFGYLGDPGAEAIVRHRFTREEGRRLLAGRAEPFVMGPDEIGQTVKLVENSIARANAIAPLHDLEGFVVVRSPHENDHDFSDGQLRLLASLSYQASSAMQKSLLYRKQKESAETANALLDFSRELATAEPLDEVLTRTVTLTARIMGSPRASVWLTDPRTNELVVKAHHGFTGRALEALHDLRVPVGGWLHLLEVDEPFVMSAEQILETLDGHNPLLSGPTALAPFRIEGGRIGAITAAVPATDGPSFPERKMKLLAGIAHQARLAIGSASSYEQLERTFLSTVEALVNALGRPPLPAEGPRRVEDGRDLG